MKKILFILSFLLPTFLISQNKEFKIFFDENVRYAFEMQISDSEYIIVCASTAYEGGYTYFATVDFQGEIQWGNYYSGYIL